MTEFALIAFQQCWQNLRKLFISANLREAGELEYRRKKPNCGTERVSRALCSKGERLRKSPAVKEAKGEDRAGKGVHHHTQIKSPSEIL